ncbi:hypothetical protein PG229_004295 [Escherichia coli]|nr:hypothetical protein [Escherichia coli]
MSINTLQRKCKKLFRDPKNFFKDSKVMSRIATKEIIETKNIIREINNHSIGKIFFNENSVISFDFIGNTKPNNYAFSSVIVKERKSSSPKNEPIYANILKNPKNFIGFRENNVFLCDAGIQTLEKFIDIREAFQNKNWISTPFSPYKNIFIVDPENNLPQLIKSTSPLVFVHCIFTEKSSKESIERCIKWCGGIDIAILHSSHGEFSTIFNRAHIFSSTIQLLKGIADLILINGSKPYDLLIPCFGDAPFLDNIDELNEESHDIYIKTNKKLNPISKTCTFEEIAMALSQSTSFVLCRESIYQRYEDIIIRGDLHKFILATAKDGLRVEVSE